MLIMLEINNQVDVNQLFILPLSVNPAAVWVRLHHRGGACIILAAKYSNPPCPVIRPPQLPGLLPFMPVQWA
jgi:hypothetical protein